MSGQQQITVHQLITLLNQLPDKEALVWVEGCDCYQKASHLRLENPLGVIIGNTKSPELESK